MRGVKRRLLANRLIEIGQTSARHHKAEAFDLRFRRRQDPHDLTAEEHRNPVSEVEDFLELRRNENNSAPMCSLGEQLGPHRLDRPDIQPTSWLLDEEEQRLAHQLAPEHDLLQIAAGQFCDRKIRSGCPHAKSLDQPNRMGRGPLPITPPAAPECKLPLRAEDDIVGERQFGDRPDVPAVGRKIGDVVPAAFRRRLPGDVASFE